MSENRPGVPDEAGPMPVASDGPRPVPADLRAAAAATSPASQPTGATPGGPGTPGLLIVNADDYGLTLGISEGILRAHRMGIVTSTSVLAVGPAFPKVAPWLADDPDLGVGVHLAIVGDDPPLLPAREIPTLVDRRGRLYRTWRTFLLRWAGGRVDAADVAREFDAQFRLVRDLGLPITHLDAHQHLQLWSPIGEVVLGVARRYGVPAIRVPHFRAPRPTSAAVTLLARRLAREATRAGIGFPNQSSGIEVAGRLDLPLLERVLGRLARRADPVVELTVHPGEADDPDRARYRWGYRWPDELEALTSPGAREAVARHGFTLASYAHFYDAVESGR